MLVDNEIQDFLEHHGIKGMRWGVLKKEDRTGLASKFESFSHKQKYGSMNDKEEKVEDQGFFKRLTPGEKKAALIFGGSVVVAGIAYGAHHYGASSRFLDDPHIYLDGKNPLDGLHGVRNEGLLAYRHKGIELPAGTLVARVSSDIEKTPRPGGFYAAHEYEDVRSYTGWLGKVGGHTNYFRAEKAIKVPSTDEYVSMLSKAMNHPDILKARNVNPRLFNRLSSEDKDKVLFHLATREVSNNNFAFSLNASTADGLLPTRFVKEVFKNGYTSVIDYNNATSSIAKAPLRHLDGNMFKFVSSEPITSEVKQLASLNEDEHLRKLAEFYDSVKHSIFTSRGTLMKIEEFLEHISMKAWSDYKESDYTLEQWDKACLIHDHAPGETYTKADCKLPIKTPEGMLNMNGVFAAAAALAGARTPIKATPDQKAKAARALIAIYGNLKKTPPDSLTKLAHSNVQERFKMEVTDEVAEFLEHHGVPGMKWGQRRAAKRTERQQRNINAFKRVAAGKGSKSEKFRAATTVSPIRLIRGRGLQGGTKLTLLKAEKTKKSIEAGHKKVTNVLLRANGVNVKNLDFSSKVGARTPAEVKQNRRNAARIAVGSAAALAILGSSLRA